MCCLDVKRHFVLGLILWFISLPAWAASGHWLLVDTRAETISVMRGTQTVLDVFRNIALGAAGAGIKRQRGDGVTPLGSFQVNGINPRSRFNLFIGLNYPNLEYGQRAHREGRIDNATYRAIEQAVALGQLPPQNTILGGAIGIHGIGSGDPFVHANINWTNGCVALTNEQIRRLASWVEVGMRVEIR